MKITNLNSASVIVESMGVKILTDPWLVDGEHYGSWAIYPPFEFKKEDFEDIDFIYISHIHHDHCSLKTLSLLKKDIPILIHRYEAQFLKFNLERLGFRVLELNHNTRTHLKNGVYINILAADNCNPELCHRYYGCGIVEAKFGSTQIDTLSVIDDGKYTVVNTNDCPFDLSKNSIKLINENYKHINFLLLGYLGAGPYPQCFASLNEEEKRLAAEKKEAQFLTYGKNFLLAFKPQFYMPFAGTYVLSGKLAKKNDFRGNPEIDKAKSYFENEKEIDSNQHKCVLLNPKSSFNLETKKSSQVYQKVGLMAKKDYIENVLSKRKLDYEKDVMPKLEHFKTFIPKAYERLNAKRLFTNFETKTWVIVPLVENIAVKISMEGKGFEYIQISEIEALEKYVSITIDPRLLIKILQGPRFAHYNNAEGGSHIEFFRKPKHLFERAIYYNMNFFHA